MRRAAAAAMLAILTAGATQAQLTSDRRSQSIESLRIDSARLMPEFSTGVLFIANPDERLGTR